MKEVIFLILTMKEPELLIPLVYEHATKIYSNFLFFFYSIIVKKKLLQGKIFKC